MSDHWIPGHDGIPRTPPAVEAMTPAQLERDLTPDGVRLAPWWRRVVAYWVDGLLMAIAVQAVLLPLQLVGDVTWFGSMPSDVAYDAWFAVGSDSWWYLMLSIACTLALSAAYAIVMLSRVGWTIGKRILGIRVRHRVHERLPTAREATARWAVQLAPAALTTAGPIGAAASLWVTIDGLRALVHVRRQAFHDSAARTSVVMA